MKLTGRVALVTALFATPAWADGFEGQFDGGLGFGGIAEDWFVKVSVGAAFQFDKIGFGVQVPLNFRAIDYEPEQDSVIREEDWDEVGDFFKILRYFQYGFPNEPYYVRVGELTGVSIGHGTVVNSYYNVVDVNHYKMGIRSTIDVGYGGVEVMIDHVAPPNLLAIRPFVRPFTFFPTADIFKKVTTGLVFAADFDAPTALKVDAGGVPVIEEAGPVREASEPVILWGWDLDWEVFSNEWVAIIPFFDVMVLGDEGAGTHLGTFINFSLPANIHIDTRIEWRFASKGYQPTYISPIYEIERWRFVQGPKITDVRAGFAGADSDRHGLLGSLTFRVDKWVTVTAAYEDYQGPDNANFTARLELPWIADVVQAAAYWTKRNFDDAEDLGSLDNALLIAMLRVKVYDPLYLWAEYSRQWHVDETGTDRGEYETVDNFGGGVGVHVGF